MSRKGILALVAAVSVLAAGLGWVLGQQIKSPAEIAAETAPPEPSLITVPIELRELSSRVVARGTVQSSEETPISIAGAAEGNPIVTRMPRVAGDELNEGEVVIEITGRPVIALQGRLPVYRSMGPSLEGPDVAQLEAALQRLGFSPGDVDDVYTSATATAVENLYRSLGYKANGPSPDEIAALDSASDRVTAAEKLVNDAGGSSSSDGVPESVKLQEDQWVDQAQRLLDDAKAQRSAGTAAAQQAVDASAADLADAQAMMTTAKDRLAKAQAGTHPDSGVAPTPDELVALQAAVTEAEAAVSSANTAKDEAGSALATAAQTYDRAITDAETGVAIAVATRKETFASYTDQSGGGDDGGSSLTDLKKNLTDARAALVDLQATTGVGFPAFELVFVPTLPRKVQSVSVELGSAAQGSVMSVTGTSTILQSAVSSADRKLLVNGLDASIEDEELGVSAPATITYLADEPGGGELPADRYAMQLTPSADLPEEAYYQSLKVTIPISSTGGEVLAVPLAAVSAAADGSPRVEVRNSDGSTRLVEIITGLAADGFVEIKPTDDSISEGDRVVVGRDLQLPSSDSEEDEGDDKGEAADE